MLNIYFGSMPEAIFNTSVYFDNTYDESWFEDDFARRAIKKIDKSEVIDSRVIDSPVLGIIPPERIAGGTKTLILIKNCPDKIFNASTCGDNCSEFILELADSCDITINLRHIMKFSKRKFKAHIMNNDTYTENFSEYLDAACEFL